MNKPTTSFLAVSIAACGALVCSHRAVADETPPAGVDSAIAETSVDPSTEGARGGGLLDIYGFMDFTYFSPLWIANAPFAPNFPYKNNFAIGNINVYLAKSISERCRSLLEVRFLYEPNGAPDSATGTFVDTSTPDHADYDRPLHPGGIEIQRAYAECDLLSGLSVRVGQWLTPYGIWNVDHGTPTLIAINKPFIIGNELFPQRQTGISLYGSRNFGDFRVGYGATLSNGRGPIDSYRDLDTNKAFGLRLELQWSRRWDITGGASYYQGRYTAADSSVFDFASRTVISKITSQYDEQSFGADLKVNFKGLALRAEWITNARVYTPDGRPMASAGLFVPDSDRHGYYALLGYRLPFFGIMPYTMYMRERAEVDPRVPPFNSVWGVHVGLNILLSPAMVLKFEYLISGLLDEPSDPVLGAKFKTFTGQLSWVF